MKQETDLAIEQELHLVQSLCDLVHRRLRMMMIQQGWSVGSRQTSFWHGGGKTHLVAAIFRRNWLCWARVLQRLFEQFHELLGALFAFEDRHPIRVRDWAERSRFSRARGLRNSQRQLPNECVKSAAGVVADRVSTKAGSFLIAAERSRNSVAYACLGALK